MSETEMIVTAYHHFGMPVEQADLRPPRPAFDVREIYPCLEAASEEMLLVVLELLAYQRGTTAGLSATCRRADYALAIARGEQKP